MPKVIVTGRGGSGKSTLVTLVARVLAGRQEQVLVVDPMNPISVWEQCWALIHPEKP